jgi:hypothetical protein
MATCRRCGAELDDNQPVCKSCGMPACDGTVKEVIAEEEVTNLLAGGDYARADEVVCVEQDEEEPAPPATSPRMSRKVSFGPAAWAFVLGGLSLPFFHQWIGLTLAVAAVVLAYVALRDPDDDHLLAKIGMGLAIFSLVLTIFFALWHLILPPDARGSAAPSSYGITLHQAPQASDALPPS